MTQVFAKDIGEKRVFTRIGCTYYQVYADKERHICIYDIINQDGIHRGYEVVRGVKHKNPDGTIVHAYPSSEAWGTYGYTVPRCSWADAVIEFIMSAPSRSAQEIYEFKKTLKTPAISL